MDHLKKEIVENSVTMNIGNFTQWIDLKYIQKFDGSVNSLLFTDPRGESNTNYDGSVNSLLFTDPGSVNSLLFTDLDL